MRWRTNRCPSPSTCRCDRSKAHRPRSPKLKIPAAHSSIACLRRFARRWPRSPRRPRCWRQNRAHPRPLLLRRAVRRRPPEHQETRTTSYQQTSRTSLRRKILLATTPTRPPVAAKYSRRLRWEVAGILHQIGTRSTDCRNCSTAGTHPKIATRTCAMTTHPCCRSSRPPQRCTHTVRRPNNNRL